MHLARISRAGCAAAMLACCASEARAQTEAKPLAEALFQDGRDLLAAGKTAEACAKFAMSQRVEPKLGTLLNLAACHEAMNKTATAWAEFTEGSVQAQRADQPEREHFAREHADALAPRLSKVVISAEGADPLVVSIDGVAVDRAALGTALPLDPGEHVIEASAPGKKPWRGTVVVPSGPARLAVQVPALASEGEAAAPLVPAAPTARSDEPSYAWIPFGLSGIALGTGTRFGLLAFEKKDLASAQCVGDVCSQRGLDLYDDAERSATISTVAFAVGVAAVGVGIYLLVRSRSAPSTAHVSRAVRSSGFAF